MGTEEKGRPSAGIFGGHDAEGTGERAPGLALATAFREEDQVTPGTCRQQGTEMANREPCGAVGKAKKTTTKKEPRPGVMESPP